MLFMEAEGDDLREALLGRAASQDRSGGGDEHLLEISSPGRGLLLRDFKARMMQYDDVSNNPDLPEWIYPDDGEACAMSAPKRELDDIRAHMDTSKHLLSEWPSTSICGNDILASVLYSSGIVAIKAGKITPLTQVLVAVVLYFFRYIYEEAVTAIPLNGGSYNVLLNTTSKRVAAVAATLGIISYLATGVVSATSAMSYLNTQVEVPIVFGTIVLLFAFALLSIIGIGESAQVALVIFVGHVITLSLLSVCSAIYAFQNPHIFWDNMKTDFPDVDVAGSRVKSNFLSALFFGYSSAMLGITGFETSAQFVEQQEPGVFRKTLRNMWLFATFYNVLLSVLSLAVLPLEGPTGIYNNKDTVLAIMAHVSSGPWLQRWVSIDAFVVLAGGVLTSYVGITGLVRRLAFDRVLPAFLTHENECRKTNHHIILLFFGLQASLVILLNADATILAGVFTFAFLGVMSLFAFGCMLLKLKREEIPRDVNAPWWSCIFGLLMVLAGLLGNLLGDPTILTYFAIYFISFAAVMFLMLERVFILRILLYLMQKICPSRPQASENKHHTGARGGRTIAKVLQEIHLPPVVFLCKSPDLSVVNKAILYVRNNEQTHNLRIVHVCEEIDTAQLVTDADKQRHERLETLLQDFRDMVSMFDLMYPKLKIDFVSVAVPGGAFTPVTVEWISREMKVPPNMMFIRQPGTKSIHQVSTLAIRPWSLFASAIPVVITVSLLRISHGISFARLDVLAAVAMAMIVQMIANLNSVYSNLHRSFQPAAPTAIGKPQEQHKVVINLLSQKLVQLWSFVYLAAMLAILAISYLALDKTASVCGGLVGLVLVSFLYCRSGEKLNYVFVEEFVFATAAGPLVMTATAVYLIDDAAPWSVIMYANVVFLLTLAFQSARDVPFVRRLGRGPSSLALRLGFEWSFKTTLLLTSAGYGLMLLYAIVLGHAPNVLLMLTMSKVKTISEAFRNEQLRDLPDQMANLLAFVGMGLIASINVSSFML
ncbi:TPA: hypothetical protein N0F65_009023 [Lagenidium giganteum]|uniref:Transmembrane protein n=1 Tax=Lagenidium giganteum TaxID=4803 RepID=A0AAV2YV73_9STRA|nr:TPA: hypothetical protein N0F65_009023 [Lagenidium giganteum]